MGQKSPFQITVERLVIDENIISRAPLITRFLTLNLRLEQSYSFARTQMSERRSNTISVVVERPDHHYGDDLVCTLLDVIVLAEYRNSIARNRFLLALYLHIRSI